jgi:hypothetical protein
MVGCFPNMLGKAQPKPQVCDTTGTPITVTSIDIPLVLVKDKSNTREASRVTLGGLDGRSKELEECPYRSRSRMEMRLEKKSYELVNGCQGCVPAKQC